MNQESSDSEILVVGICGSLRSGSYTRMAVERIHSPPATGLDPSIA